jgi:hypothetical protein
MLGRRPFISSIGCYLNGKAGRLEFVRKLKSPFVDTSSDPRFPQSPVLPAKPAEAEAGRVTKASPALVRPFCHKPLARRRQQLIALVAPPSGG